MSGRKALVTGGAGFIGSHLAARLLREGWEVSILDNFSTGRRENLEPITAHVGLRVGDVRQLEDVERALERVEVVFHLAADPSVPRSIDDPFASLSINALGTLNLLTAARAAGTRRLIFASSTAVYGRGPSNPKCEHMREEPIVPYSVNKLTAEGYCRTFSELHGLETAVLRYFNVFGPRQDPTSQYSAAIAKFVDCFLANESPTIFGDGKQTRDFCHVENIVHANLLAAESDVVLDGLPINIASGVSVSLLEVVELLCDLTGRDLRANFEAVRAGDIRHSAANIDRAREVIGYVPIMDLREGLTQTLAEWAS